MPRKQPATIDDLTPDDQNPRLHGERNRAMIAESLQRFGPNRGVVINAAGKILAGNGVVEAAREAGITDIRVIPADGKTLTVVQVDHLTPDQEREYAIADNRAGELAEWNIDILQATDRETLDTWWFVDELAELFGTAEPVPDQPTATAPPSLADRFLVPPFSVLDARQGYWQERKRQWLGIGIESELGRGEHLTVHSEHVASDGLNYYRDQNKATGRLTYATGADRTDDASGKNLAAGRKKPDTRAIKDHDWQAKTLGKVQAASNPLTYRGAASDQDFAGQEMTARGGGTSIFDPVLCELMYRWFSPPGGMVLDPFAGGSVRGIVATLLGRRYVGIDLSEAQVAANRDQAERITPDASPAWEVGDSLDLVPHIDPGSVDFVFSCPPYADLEVYSDDPRDLSTMDYADFLAAYRRIIAASCERLAPDRFACFVVGDVRDKKGIYRNFVGDTISAFLDAGLHLYNDAILVTAIGSLSIRAGKQFTASRKLGKTHQNVLLFVKGDPRKATTACGTITIEDLNLGDDDGDDIS